MPEERKLLVLLKQSRFEVYSLKFDLRALHDSFFYPKGKISGKIASTQQNGWFFFSSSIFPSEMLRHRGCQCRYILVWSSNPMFLDKSKLTISLPVAFFFWFGSETRYSFGDNECEPFQKSAFLWSIWTYFRPKFDDTSVCRKVRPSCTTL